MGYLLVTAVLVVTFGRLGDQYGRARLFNLGFGIFTVASVACALVPSTGVGRRAGADRAADRAGRRRRDADRQLDRDHHRRLPARPARFRARREPGGRPRGSFVGLVIGGLLAEWHWRAVFWVSVPVGHLGHLDGLPARCATSPGTAASKVTIDWWGNLTFGLGLIAMLVAHHLRLAALRRAHHGLDAVRRCWPACWLARCCWSLRGDRESGRPNPMINLKLFKIRAFAAGNSSTCWPRWPAAACSSS